MAKQYVTKVQRQHSSMVTSVPLAVRVKLGLSMGDHVVWQVDDISRFVQLSKVETGGKNHAVNSGGPDKKDQSGRA